MKNIKNNLLPPCLPLFNHILTDTDFNRGTVIADLKKLDDPRLTYIMAIFLDEYVLHSSWEGRLGWMGRSLQLELFGEHIGGEVFFNQLSQLRQNPHAEIDLLEIYYLCLHLGFQGKYRLTHPETLINIKTSLQHQINTIRQEDYATASLTSTPPHEFIQKMDNEVPYWVITLTTLLIIFFIAFGYNTAMNSTTDHTLNTVKWEINHHDF